MSDRILRSASTPLSNGSASSDTVSTVIETRVRGANTDGKYADAIQEIRYNNNPLLFPFHCLLAAAAGMAASVLFGMVGAAFYLRWDEDLGSLELK